MVGLSFVMRYTSFVSGCFLMLGLGTTYAFSVYSGPLADMLGYKQSEINLAPSLGSIGTYLGSIIFGLLLDKYGPTPTALGSSVFLFGGWLLLYFASLKTISYTPAFLGMYYSFQHFGLQGAYFTAFVGNVSNFKVRNRGLVTGVLASNLGISAVLISQAYTHLFYKDVPTLFLFLAFLSLALCICGACAIRVVKPYSTKTRRAMRMKRLREAEALLAASAPESVGLLSDSETSGSINGDTSDSGPSIADLSKGRLNIDIDRMMSTNDNDAPGITSNETGYESDTVPPTWKSRTSDSSPQVATIVDARETNSVEQVLGDDGLLHPVAKNVPRYGQRKYLSLSKQPDIYILIGMIVTIAGTGLTLNTVIGSVAKAWRADEVYDTSTFTSVLAISNCVGRLIFGGFNDLFRRYLRTSAYMMGMAVMCGVAQVILLVWNSPISLIMASILTGSSYGGFYTLLSIVINKYYGDENYGANMGVTIVFSSLASLAWGQLSGRLYDHFADPITHRCYGDICYRYTFLTTSILCAIGFGLAIFLFIRERRDDIRKARERLLGLSE